MIPRGSYHVPMQTRVRIFVTLTAAMAIVCAISAGFDVPVLGASRHWNAIVAVSLLEFLSEASYLRLRLGAGDSSKSVAFIPQIASILLFDTGWVVSMAAAAELAVEYGVRKKPGIKIAFNVSQVVVSLSLASWAYHSLGGIPSLTTFAPPVLATAVAVVTYFVINDASVAAVVSISDRVHFDDAWRRLMGPSPIYDLIASALALLLAYLYVNLQLIGALLLVIPLLFMRHIYQVNLRLEQVNRDLLELMVKAIEARDPYTSGHSLRVARVAGQLAREHGLGSKTVEQVTTAALLHDVGKIYEDFAPLLRKESKLSSTEKALMQTHPSRSADLVRTISAFQGPIEEAVRHHHENYDGTGYPTGLSGDAIPVGARIIMIADTMDAMTTDRPYRRALTFDRVVEELRKFSGTQFDPELVEVVVRSSAVRAMVAARAARESPMVPSGGLEVFAGPRQPARSGRAVAGG